MKTILFITNEFPAKTSSTSLAAELVINSIKEYNVKILSISGAEDEGKGIYTIKCNSKNSIMNSFFKKISLIIMGIFYPISRPLLIFKLIRKANIIIKKNNIDAIISVCFPIETLIVGNYIKRKNNDIKYIPYFIDGYACGILPKYLPKKFARKRKIAFEKKVIKNADIVVRMKACKDYYDNLTWKEKCIYLNPAFLSKPIIDYNCKESTIIEENMINIVYAGYIFLPDRNPSYIIDSLSNNSKYCLIFIGKNEAKNIIKEKEKSFKGKIKIVDYINNDKLKIILNQADIFLNIGVENSNAISGKIFDYFSYGKPIISTFFKDDDATLEYLKKYELSLCINQNKESIENAYKKISQFIDSNLHKRITYEEVEKNFYDSTPKAFLDSIKDIL